MLKIKLQNVVLVAVAAAFLVFVVGLVVSSLVRPELDSFVPSPVAPEEVGARRVGPLTYTIDATAHDGWAYFDFSRGSRVEVETRAALDWDIAFQRHRMLTNGGATNPLGRAGAIDLGPLSIDSAAIVVPAEGFIVDQRRGDVARNSALEDWYEYSWVTHVLRPADRTYGLRTADGRYAVMRILSYYCPGGRPGCVTFRYRYRGDGGREFPGLE